MRALRRHRAAAEPAVDELEKISHERKEAHAKLLALKSRVYAAFLRMEEAAFAEGALPKKVKELIAVGISVRIDCESCMQRHIEQEIGRAHV